VLTVGSLFAGIGGFDLGLERAGMRVVWQCESNAYCRAVLRAHWPGVPCFDDVCQLSGPDVQPVDVLAGGFPCQDLSLAGSGAGLSGARSGLWAHFARLVGELRPRYVLVENVPALLARGMGIVVGDLAALGYDAEWDCVSAAEVGAPHLRRRLWLVAYPNGGGWDGGTRHVCPSCRGHESADVGQPVPHPHGARPQGPQPEQAGGRPRPSDGSWWAAEPDVGRVADGVPQRMDRLQALGNSLVPQIAQWIGERIVRWESP
jgi:DNA (cytosine-5)-methyltransferase 1